MPLKPVDAVPWDTVDAFHATTRGSYTQTIGLTGGGMGQMPLMRETVRFDLDAPYIERTVFVSEDTSTDGDPGGELRFVYTDMAMLMWHPNTVETCGTHWIDMADAPYDEIMGADLQPGDLLAVKPLEFLAAATGEPRHLETTSSGSTYEITAPAELALPISSTLLENPGAQEAITGIDAVAEVVLPEAGTSLTISVDSPRRFWPSPRPATCRRTSSSARPGRSPATSRRSPRTCLPTSRTSPAWTKGRPNGAGDAARSTRW